MDQITFRLAAYCDTAGKQSGKNEDNYLVDDSLSANSLGNFITDKETILSGKGALFVVADGMGGVKAGEVASELVIETVKEHFTVQCLNENILATESTRRKYLRETIIAADQRIKAAGKDNPNYEGMGSTIVIAWLFKDCISIAWVGDSRAYRYNPVSGLEQLSHDHSYVQELVDKGLLLPEYAFDHPDGNIITRSLGDYRKKVKPDSDSWKVNEKDIFLFCSDGLCGVVRDEEIEDIISQNSESMLQCQQALWTAAEDAGWYDNMTTILCEVLSVGTEERSEVAEGKSSSLRNTLDGKPVKPAKKKRTGRWVILLIFLIALIAAGIKYCDWGLLYNKAIEYWENLEFNKSEKENQDAIEVLISAEEQEEATNELPVEALSDENVQTDLKEVESGVLPAKEDKDSLAQPKFE